MATTELRRPIPTGRTQVHLFEGDRQTFVPQVQEFLAELPAGQGIAAFGYNYQAGEYDGRAEVHPATHGLMLLIDSTPWGGRAGQGSSRTMSDVEAAWCGAMLDAEGSVIVRRGKTLPRVTFGNTDVELVSAFLRCSGFGSIGYDDRETKFGKGKPLLSWTATGVRDTLAFMLQVYEYSVKVQRWFERLEAAA